MRGMRENALNCKAVGGIVPTGYKVDHATMKYVIDAPKAAIIREVFELYANGNTIVDICKHCNDHGYRTSKDLPFTRNSLSTILKNRKYIGIYKFDDIEIEGGMPAIVDKETFERVQQRISMGNKSKPRKHEDVEFLLTGKLFCGHCGKAMVGISGTGKNGQPYYYYSCRQHGHKCIKSAERKDKLEEFVINYITECFLTKENIHTVAGLIMEAINNDEWSMKIKGVEKQIREVDSRISNLMKAVEVGGALAPVMERISELTDDKNVLESELSRLKIENMSFLTQEMVEFWMHDIASKNDGSVEYYRSLINTFVNAIYVYDTNEPEDDPSGKKSRKRKVVLAFNTSGPESQVTLDFVQAHVSTTRQALHETSDMFIVSGGRIILIVLDYY